MGKLRISSKVVYFFITMPVIINVFNGGWNIHWFIRVGVGSGAYTLHPFYLFFACYSESFFRAL